MNERFLPRAAVIAGLSLAPLCCDSALADKRVALVVGNSAYRNAPHLPTPRKDAQAVAAMLEKAGFSVVSAHYDLGTLQLRRAIRQFEAVAVDADIAVVFYAGHGMEVQGTNFLIPTDAQLRSDLDVEDEAISLGRIQRILQPAKWLRLIILDASRDNPFDKTMKRTPATLAYSRGLAEVESGSDTLIAFAAKAGSTALDGTGAHSPFTEALLKHMVVPGLDVRLAFGRVRDEVLQATGNRQEPFLYGSLGGQQVSLVPAPDQPRVGASDLSGQRSAYELVEKIGQQGAWEVFLRQHPTGFYAELARQQLAKLVEQQNAARQRVQEQASAKAAADEATQQRTEREAVLREALAAFIGVGGAGSEVDRARALLGSLDRERDIRAVVNRGRSYALIIGNKDYSDSKFSKLETPHEDARSLVNVLMTRYGFTTELILGDEVRSLFLLDRPARELYSLLDDLEESMTSDDRLLIFYAGHGHLDESTGKAYWIPVEAHKGRRSEFISADAIVSALRGIKARSVLVLADSCFSGALFRGPSPGPDPSEEELASSLAKDAERPSRVLIASGGTEPVLDGGGSGHSIFMRKLLDALANPIRPIFSARELHVRRLKPTVSGSVKQVPQYDYLRESGHDAGDFVFVQVQPTQSAASK
jgi:uncharacterized caspase-like protein